MKTSSEAALNDEELVYALRNNVGVSDNATRAAHLAADRIEQLVATNEQLVHEASLHETAMCMIDAAWDEALQQRDEAEAKLAKAVDALRIAIDVMWWVDGIDAAEAVLAKLEKTE